MSEHDQQQPAGNEQARVEASAGERGGRSGGGGERRRGRRRHSSQQQGGGGSSASQPHQSSRRQEASLNMSELRELVELFTTHGLTDFELENEEIRVRLSKNTVTLSAQAPMSLPTAHVVQDASAQAAAATQATPGAQTPPPSAGASSAEAAPGASNATTGEAAAAEDLHIITSPIVGTFYRSPSPTSESFVRIGSHVEPDTVVCIIEAMKLMNEIESDAAGTVEKIYVENGQPVEYGQPLFGIKK